MACTLYETSPALELILDPKEEGWRRFTGLIESIPKSYLQPVFQFNRILRTV